MQTYYPGEPFPDPPINYKLTPETPLNESGQPANGLNIRRRWPRGMEKFLRENQYIETSDGKCRYYPNK